MAATSELSRRVEATLRAVLPNSVDLELRRQSDARSNDFEAIIRDRVLRVEWKSQAWLNVVEDILARSDHPDIVVADRVPPASRQVLTEAGIGWVETTGAAEIDTDFLVLSRSGGLPTAGKVKDNWTPAVVGVAEAVLAGVKPTVSATHKATGLSVGACTRALRVLTEMEYLKADAARGPQSGREIADRDTLLDAYVAAAHDIESPNSLAVGITWRDPIDGLSEIGARWDDSDIPWVATGLVAAAVVAPLVTSVGTADVYVMASSTPELESAAAAAGLKPIEGGRLVLSQLPTPTTLEMATVVDGLSIAPWPRLVADLRRAGVRGEEAAEHVKEVLASG